jgi:hypothetical protein
LRAQGTSHLSWSRGYGTTSVRDLGSGDRVRRFEGNLSMLAALKAFFSGIIERSVADKERKGSVVVNSELELAVARTKCSTSRPPTGSSR